MNDGHVVAWGNEDDGGKIPDDIQSQLQNVQTIISNATQFTAVCTNGEKYTW